VINSPLHQELVRVFKDVRVDDEDVPSQRPQQTGPEPPGLADVAQLGERYAVACPYCRTVHPTLYVGNEWQKFGDESDPLGRVHCLLGCLDNPARREDLRLAVWHYWESQSRSAEPGLPVTFVRLDELPVGHQARQYLEGRGFDVHELSTRWGVGYCDVSISENPKVFDRIIIPIYGRPRFSEMAPRLAGWTGRATNESTEPKYCNRRGFHKKDLVYRRPGANKTPVIVVVEGPTDAWRLGDCAVALLGKKLSDPQRFLIRTLAIGRPIVLMYDPDAAKDMPKARLKLLRERRGDGGDVRVLLATLPPGRKDPGECTPAELEESIANALGATATCHS